MKTNWIKTAGLIAGLALLTTGIHAQHHRQGPGGRGYNNEAKERMAGYLALDLTEEQQETLKTLRTENYKTMTPLKNKMNELKARERTLLSEETVDLKAVNKLIDEQTGLSNQMRKIQAAHKVEMKKILTDEQLMKLEQRREFSKNRRFNREGPYRDRRPGDGRRSAGPYQRNWS